MTEIRVGNYGISNDGLQWIVVEYGDVVAKDGSGIKEGIKRKSYYSRFESVIGAVADRTLGELWNTHVDEISSKIKEALK